MRNNYQTTERPVQDAKTSVKCTPQKTGSEIFLRKLRGGEKIKSGTLYAGEEIKPGTLHGGEEIKPGTLHGGEEIKPGTLHGGEEIKPGMLHGGEEIKPGTLHGAYEVVHGTLLAYENKRVYNPFVFSEQLKEGTLRADISPATYRTKDGGSYYKFRHVDIGGKYEIDIIEQPSYHRRNTDAHIIHRLPSSRGGQKICISSGHESATLEGAKNISIQWAELTNEYIKTGKTLDDQVSQNANANGSGSDNSSSNNNKSSGFWDWLFG